MYNALITLIVLSISTISNASEYKGIITTFSGTTVETRMPYIYTAIKTTDGQRIKLPNWIKLSQSNSLLNSVVTFDAMVSPVFCTDMSSACMTGYLENIRSFKITFPKVSSTGLKTYSSKLERFSGRAVESRRTYSYIAINDKIKIAVPSFLDAEILLNSNAQATVKGMPKFLACTDMSAACGPTELSPLKSVEVRF